MKKLGVLLSVVFLAACNNTATVKIDTDSAGTKLEHKFDTVSANIQEQAGKAWDSTKAGLKEAGKNIKEKVKEGLDNVEVNIKRDTSGKKQ